MIYWDKGNQMWATDIDGPYCRFGSRIGLYRYRFQDEKQNPMRNTITVT
jgi:hypothetical protein